MELDEYAPALRRADARFAEVAAAAAVERGWSAPVPGCPGWDLADLVWHLAEVQDFWAWVVRTRAQDPSGYPAPQRPPDDQLLGYLAGRSAALETVLDGADPAEPVWTWAPQRDAGHDVAFVLRRQLHEVVVHTADAEQVTGDVRPIPPVVGLDGVDEFLQVIVPGALPDGPPPEAHPLVLWAVDVRVERTLFPGTRPVAAARLIGTAGDLLLALWRRLPVEVLTAEGDAATAAAVLQLVDLR